MKTLTRKSFAKPLGCKTVAVPVPELGEDNCINIRQLTSSELLHLRKLYGTEGDTGLMDFACDLLARVLVDDKGVPLFADKDDVLNNLQVPMPIFTKLADAAIEVSGLDYKKKD